MKYLTLLLLCCMVFTMEVTIAQVQVDKQLQMTGGTNADRQITNVGVATAASHAVNAGVVQSGTLTFAASSGSGGNYTVTLSPAPASYAAGMRVSFTANHANTGAATLNVNGLGAQSIRKQVTANLVAGDIASGRAVSVIYDGTNFQLISNAGTLPAGSDNYIQNQTSTDQSAGFRISGDGLIGGDVGIGTTTPGSKLHVRNGNISVHGPLPSNVWGQVIGLGSSGASGTTQGIIGHQGGHNLDIFWNFHRIDATSTYTGLATNGSNAANAISLGASGIRFFATTTMGATHPPEVIRINNSGNVGIGTTAPLRALHIEGDDASTSRIRLTRSGTDAEFAVLSGNAIVAGASGISMYTGAGSINAVTEKVTVTSAGSVGIGITSPAAQLHVNAPSGVGINVTGGLNGAVLGRFQRTIGSSGIISLASGGGYVGMHLDEEAGTSYTVAVSSSIFRVMTGYLSDGTDRLVVNSSGNVGIGTSSPAYKLDVFSSDASNARIGRAEIGGWPANTDYAYFGNRNLNHAVASNYALVQHTGGTTLLNSVAGTPIHFRHGNSTQMILSNGDLGLGTAAPTAKFDISNAGSGGAGIVGAGEHLNITAFAPNITFVDQSASVDAFAMHLNQSIFTIGRYTGPTAVQPDLVVSQGRVGVGNSFPAFTLDVNGSINATAGYFAVSDQRLKTNISSITGAIDKLKQINGYAYEWKQDENPETHFKKGTDYGVLAQEVEKIFPTMVMTNQHGNKAVNYDNLIPLLIEAIKEQEQRIEQLEKELADGK